VSQFELGRRATGDLREIWEFAAEDSFIAAERLLEEFYRAF
jgi:plasmid stabilization system protein ParE